MIRPLSLWKRVMSLFSLFFLLLLNNNYAQVVINEVIPGSDRIEFKNIGSSAENIANFWVYNHPNFSKIRDLNLVCGSLMLGPGEIATVSGLILDGSDGELGLYYINAFGSQNALLDYVEWGSAGHLRSSVAIAKGIWTSGSFVPSFSNSQSIAYDGMGDASSDWTVGNPTVCMNNNGETEPCNVNAGNIVTRDATEICAGDGIADPIMVYMPGSSGTVSGWVITDENGNILALPPAPPFDFEGAGAGICLIWHIRYTGMVQGLEVGGNANYLNGCYDLSNAITVTRLAGSDCTGTCEVDGGSVTGGPYEFCVGDGMADNVTNVSLSGNAGANSQWVVTDENGMILGLPPSPEAVNFDGAGAGTCLIWHLSYEDGLIGLMMGNNALTDLEGCYDLSDDFVTVVRNQPDGGVVTGGPYEFCVGDGMADNVANVSLSGNAGANSQWVVTDENGMILGLPPSPEAVDFDGAGAGTCLIWHLSYEDGLTGLEMGNNALTDLQGCYDLSDDFVTVVRNTGDDCNVECTVDGGMVTGGPYEFCVGDGIADNVMNVSLNGNSGSNSQWVVTDEDGMILGLPPSPEAVNFDGAGPGTCLIWHLSYEDGLMGLMMGNNALTDLEGCYDLSDDFVTVVRNQPEGGSVTGGPYTFCVGDGVADNVMNVSLSGNSGTNSQWVVTDEDGMILGLPPSPEAVNFDGAGPGTCLIWHLSYEDGLTGLMMGNNALTDLEGCYDLSDDFVTVVRNQPDGGVVTGGPYEFCVGDGMADNVANVSLSGNTGANSQWVVTDENGMILGLPPSPEAVDFDGAGEGTCLIWHLSYEDGLTGLEMGNNALTDLQGCYDLSDDFVTVVRRVGEDCNNICNVNGGSVTGGPYTFCVGDGTPDNVANVALSGNFGSNSQWVVTDEDGMILGLPPSPEAVNFDGAGPGTCLIWHLSYEDGLTGLMMGNNALTDLEGCYDLSDDFVTVVRNQPEGGSVTGGPYTFCVGDGVADNVMNVSLSGNSGTNSQWVVTDEDGMILGLPPSPEAVNFDGAGPGTCLIWHLSYEDGLMGLMMGNNALTDLEGCYDLSDNFVTVVRNQPDGGIVTGGPYEFCVGDGMADNVANVSLSGNTGANSQWVVTDENGMILGLPPSPEAVDFDGAGEGTCLIWHLSYEDGLTGLEMGNNALTDLEGCYDLSDDFVTVVRRVGEDCNNICNVNGGSVTGGPYTFCVGDGTPDNVANVALSGNFGPNSQWVVTDEDGMILGLPPSPEAVNFDGAGPGTCLIWHLSYEDGLMGLMMGNNALTDLEGCYDLSDDFVTVVRNQPDGGVVTGGPYEFCVGDGMADNVANVSLSGNTGANSQWVVTDENGMILGLPPSPEAVDFDGAGPGTCLIWHLSYEDGLMGLMMGNNALTDLEGCYDLSDDFVTVVRNQPDGGVVTGGPYEFCVGDGMADNVANVSLSGNTGANSQWVVTDENGMILGLPPSPEAVDFDGAGPGTCLIWHLSYEDGLMGLMMGNNALTDLEGCYDLSDDFVTVVRRVGEDCNNICNVNGGSVTGGPYTFCVGDGTPDNVANVALSGNFGPNSQWVVTDEDGMILGLPPSPEAVNFDGAGPGTCLIWHLSYEDGLMGLMMGNNALTDLEGCYDLSDDFVTVVRNQPEGGSVTGGPYTFCVGDGVADNVMNVSLSGNSGTNSQWVVTDEDGMILGLPPSPEAVNFDGAGPGTCLIWHLSYEDGLTGLMMGNNALTDLEGCYDLSDDFVTVVRNQPDGGVVTGGPYEFCVGDGMADNVMNVSLSGNTGANSQWVVTDENGMILGLPPSPEAVDFDGAGEGTCLIWHLSYEDGLMGLMMGNNALTDLEGCYDLSDDFVTVVRNQPEGGIVTGGPYEFCVGDGMADNVANVSLSGNTGANSQWVVTDENGMILGLPPSPEAVDFDGAGEGTCLIWHLSYEDGLMGLMMGNNALTDLEGCYDLSDDFVTVVRRVGEDCNNICNVNGGSVTGGPYTFCVGDGTPDNVANVSLSSNFGPNSQWVVTDEDGMILGLPPSPEAVNFDGAGPGTCLIWHLSYEDGLTGLMMGNNALTDLEGCYDLSDDFVTVVRNQPEGGSVTGGPYTFCVGDGVADNVMNVSLSGNSGTNSQWVVTDEDGMILGLPPSPEAVNFDGAGAGTCLIWHLSYEDGLTGLMMGNNALTDLEGCYDLSDDFVTVVRNQPEGGIVTGGPYEFCVGDGMADNVANVSLSGNTGANSQWVVTDENGMILGLPPSPEAVDFDGAGEGTCLIWHLSYEDGLMGLMMGNNALTDLEGCYDLSDDFVTVVRRVGEDCNNICNVNGGSVTGGPYTFCVGDGTPDNVANVSLSSNFGPNSQWVVTDEDGMILGLPPSPEAVNFDGAGPGTCLIWHLSYEDGLTGLMMGNNALTDLEGCYDLSDDFVTVVRNQPEGGSVTGGPYTFCVGDGVADNVMNVSLSGNSGTNSQWVVTDEDGMILGLPPSPEAVDFDGAGEGTCLIWHLSYEDGLTGLEMGNNALTDLEGCYDLSDDFVTVVRNQPDGGVVTGGPYEFCVGDGMADNVMNVSLSGNTGANSQWVVTDENGMILGLPPTPEAVDFDGAGEGTCLIWHLSYEDGLTGLEMGNNALTDLQGCYDLSDDFVTVVRRVGEDCNNICNVNGGSVTGGPYTFCVGDGTPDNVANVALSGNFGPNSQWVVTDEDGMILGLPPSPEAVNFDGAGPGTCLIWHLSYEDGLTGLMMGNNALTDLEGCYDLSDDFVTVVRNQPEGGSVTGGPYEFCVGDGIADNVMNVSLNGNSGSNSQWVVTDENGMILGLPPSPEAVNFDGAGPGTCLIWHLSYEDGLTGLEMGNNALTDLEGCYDLSDDFVTVVRNQPDGGVVTGGPYEFCVGDGMADNVANVSLSGNSGSNSQWVVTDENGMILGLPPTPEAVDFDGAGEGTCLIWHLSYEDGLTGLEMGNNAMTDLEGCYDLSDDFVTVVRRVGEDCNNICNVNGGSVTGGPYTFCVGDGTPDNVANVGLTGNFGANSQWVVTDADGKILGLPPTPQMVNFDGAGAGTCLIWHLSYEDGLTGLIMGNNALTDLEGCYDLSDDFVTVVRNQPEGGSVTGGPYTFCVGDGVADNVMNVSLNGNAGTNSQWVVTDENGMILGLPPSPDAVNFDGAGPGTCLIWHLSHEDGLTGLEVGNNALTDLQGCYDLSDDFVTVVRIQPDGGSVAGGPYEFCVGDGMADNVADVSLSGNSGTNSQWVVTDEDGMILGLPPSPDVVDFDGAGEGTCLIWHLSYEDGLTGLEMGNNALTDLEGCYDLSDDFVTVVRVVGSNCSTTTQARTIDIAGMAIRLAPNPTRDLLNVSVTFEEEPEEDDLNIRILDLSGKLIQSRTIEVSNRNTQFELDINDLPAGTYILNGYNGNQLINQRFVKIK